MRESYLLNRDIAKVQPLVARIGWTHNLTILQRCREPLERKFYLHMTRKFGEPRSVTARADIGIRRARGGDE